MPTLDIAGENSHPVLDGIQARILLNKGFSLQKAGAPHGALEALAAAIPKINENREPRQKLIALFNMTNALSATSSASKKPISCSFR
jgi:hypothetical protein